MNVVRLALVVSLPIRSTGLRNGYDCQRSNQGRDYFGHKNTTISGRTCQRWDSQFPHSHNLTHDWYFPERNVGKSENYCRNPDLSERPGLWCFTTDPEVPWEYCNVPECSGFPECKQTTTAEEYSGHVSTTRSGKQCDVWGSGYSEDILNFCRNPDSKPEGPWCFTNRESEEWEYCDIPYCKHSVSCLDEPKGRRYVGTHSMTKTNVPCQRWDSVVPHVSEYKDPDEFPDDTLAEAANFCRNPASSRTAPWCYTMDPDLEWDYCDIPICEDDVINPFPKIKHVYHIGIDGLHPCFTNANITNMKKRLADQGSYTFSKGRGVLPTWSLPSWTAILCGFPPQSSGIYSNEWRPQWLGNEWSITPITGKNVPMPCLTDVLKGANADLHSAMFYNWLPLSYMASVGNPGRLDKDLYCDPDTEGGFQQCDLNIARNASVYLDRVLKSTESSYTFIYLVNVDEAGHKHSWCSQEYLDAVSSADSMVGTILDAIDQANMSDDMLVVLTTDHGGKGHKHGTFVDDDLDIPVFFRGPGIKRNFQFQRTIHLEDLAPTIAHLMGYRPSPWWSGHVMKEMLQGCEKSPNAMYHRHQETCAKYNL